METDEREISDAEDDSIWKEQIRKKYGKHSHHLFPKNTPLKTVFQNLEQTFNESLKQGFMTRHELVYQIEYPVLALTFGLPMIVMEQPLFIRQVNDTMFYATPKMLMRELLLRDSILVTFKGSPLKEEWKNQHFPYKIWHTHHKKSFRRIMKELIQNTCDFYTMKIQPHKNLISIYTSRFNK